MNNLLMRYSNFLRIAVLSLLFGFNTNIAADRLKPFTADSFQQIKSNYAGREFLLVLWSVDCPPCLLELEFIEKLLALNPDISTVLISTDPIEQREYAADLLLKFGLAEVDSWMFADEFAERLRFSIDKNWYGELPRSYFFDSKDKIQSHSGIITKELLSEWYTVPLKFQQKDREA